MNAQGIASSSRPHLIEVKVAGVHQLFNSMDPSPFHERDLDDDAEQFIVSWAQEYPRRDPLKLLLHLAKAPEGVGDPQAMVAGSVRHYFEYRADMTRRQFRQLMKEGRASLFIGMGFLALCYLVASFLPATETSWPGLLRQGLSIIGWVAMWRPLEIYLYQWWPILVLERIYRNLSVMDVEVKMEA